MEKKPDLIPPPPPPERATEPEPSGSEREHSPERKEQLEHATRAGLLAQEDIGMVEALPVPKSSAMMRKIGNIARSKVLATTMALVSAGILEGAAPSDAEAANRRQVREISWVVGSEADAALYNKQMEAYRAYQDHEAAIDQLGAMLERLERDYDQLANRHMTLKMTEAQFIESVKNRKDFGGLVRQRLMEVLQLEQQMQTLEDHRYEIQHAILEHEKGKVEAEKDYDKKQKIRTGVRIGTRVLDILTRR